MFKKENYNVFKEMLVNKISDQETSHRDRKQRFILAIKSSQGFGDLSSNINRVNLNSGSFFSLFSSRSRLKRKVNQISGSISIGNLSNQNEINIKEIKKEIINQLNQVQSNRNSRLNLKKTIIADIEKKTDIRSLIEYIGGKIDNGDTALDWKPGRLSKGSRLRQKLSDLHSSLSLLEEFEVKQNELRQKEQKRKDYELSIDDNDKLIDNFFREIFLGAEGGKISRSSAESKLKSCKTNFAETILQNTKLNDEQKSDQLALFFCRVDMYSAILMSQQKNLEFELEESGIRETVEEKINSIKSINREKKLIDMIEYFPKIKITNKGAEFWISHSKQLVSQEWGVLQIDLRSRLQEIATKFVECELQGLEIGSLTQETVKSNANWVVDKLFGLFSENDTQISLLKQALQEMIDRSIIASRSLSF